MEYYLPLKLLHIVSSTLLFGTGLGTAFYMWRADRSGDLMLLAATARNVVFADWLFTAPAVAIQPVTGLAMANALGWIAFISVLGIFYLMVFKPV